MMLFQNPGLIDLDAVRTMGVSVKRPGSFGYFGTGLKFALAVILRGGGSITIWRGDERHEISTKPTEIRGEEFDLVCLDGEPMGITTQLGRNWEPWMVLRELGCNAMDEGGSFEAFDAEAAPFSPPADDLTSIVVDWPDLDAAFEDRGNLFLDRSAEPIISDEAFEAFDRRTQFVYYRGIRAFKLDKPTALTYNLLAEQSLTEDRNLYGTYALDEAIKEFALKRADMAQAERLITIGDGAHEAGLKFNDWDKPSRAFVDASLALREAGRSFNPSARKLMLKAMRQEESAGGGSIPYKRISSAPLETAIEVLSECSISIDLAETPVIIVEELPGDALSMAENGRIYILPWLIENSESSIEKIAYELLRRWIDLKAPLDTAAEAVQILAKPLFAQSKTLARAREYEAAREADRDAEAGVDMVQRSDDEAAEA